MGGVVAELSVRAQHVLAAAGAEREHVPRPRRALGAAAAAAAAAQGAGDTYYTTAPH